MVAGVIVGVVQAVNNDDHAAGLLVLSGCFLAAVTLRGLSVWRTRR